MTSGMVKEAASPAVISPDELSSAAQKLIACDKMMAQIAGLLAKTVRTETGRVENINKTEDKVAEVQPSPPTSEPFDSKYSHSTRGSRQSPRIRNSKSGNKSTLPSGMDWGSQSKRFIATKPSARLRKLTWSKRRKDDSPRLTVI